ncbi:MAG TPA: hypothetical protein DD706_24785 [Nitrospiraceae bacterium]|nr:hypothetical protein [Nitrospiraceae bacterium]
MVLGPFAETKGPRLPGRNPATQFIALPRELRVSMESILLLTNFCFHLSPLLFEAFSCELLPHTCTQKYQQKT